VLQSCTDVISSRLQCMPHEVASAILCELMGSGPYRQRNTSKLGDGGSYSPSCPISSLYRSDRASSLSLLSSYPSHFLRLFRSLQFTVRHRLCVDRKIGRYKDLEELRISYGNVCRVK